MSFSERDQMRQIFFDAWNKYHQKQLLEPLESQLITIILHHPEYQNFLTDHGNLDKNHMLQENPFLHMSLHLALQEQINTDRPVGIKAIYNKLYSNTGDMHMIEHKMIDCLANILWDAQQANTAPDEEMYLKQLSQLI